jgi:hypothetical protein
MTALITCEGGCGRSTTDPDKWDPDVNTGRVLCDKCWDKEHPHPEATR